MSLKRNRVLVVDKMHDSLETMFLKAGYVADYRPEITPDEVHEIIHEYEGLVIRSKLNVYKALLEKAVNLKFVARAGAGIDKVDYPYLSQKGIKLLNAPEGNRDAVGEHAVGMLLSLLHNLNKGNKEVKSGKWDREGNRGWELKGRTVGIYGFGFMGSSFAEKLRGFDCRVIFYDKYKTGIAHEWVEQVDLNTFLKEVEILSIHIPLTSETRFLFDKPYLAGFPNLKVLINTSRGEVLRLSAVNDLLESGQLIGAGLDVLENEKLNQLSTEEQREMERLREKLNVILTPHVAGWTHESYQRINEVLISKLQMEGLAHVNG
ncbi:MAG: NAD(P)-dependent oxidoreductase [Marinoscillum sp.]